MASPRAATAVGGHRVARERRGRLGRLLGWPLHAVAKGVGVVTATLDQVAAMREAGVVPQNVDYAIHSDLVLQLLRRNLGDELETAASGEHVEATELISKTEGSVLLVIAR